MRSLTEILDEIYVELSLLETIDRNPVGEELPKDNYKEIWKITTEVEVGNFQKEVCLLIAFEEFFPLTIPRIYLSKGSINQIGLIPHLDKDRLICTFHTDSLVLDTNNAVGVVLSCLRKAKKIIKDGVEGTNHDDFKDELGAYWTDNDDSNTFQYVSLLSDFPKETTFLIICKLTPVFNHIRYLLYESNKNPNARKFLDFVIEKGCKCTESKALFLGDYEIGFQPPFPNNNEDILRSISLASLTTFKKYIDLNIIEKHVFFLANTSTKSILLGWKHRILNTKRNGFRQGSLTLDISVMLTPLSVILTTPCRLRFKEHDRLTILPFFS